MCYNYNVMKVDKGLEKIGDLFNQKASQQAGPSKAVRPSSRQAPAYAWQDLALRVIKELNVPNFKRSAVFKVCKQKSRIFIEQCLNDTKELCQTGEQWKYFFKVVAGTGKKKIL